MKLNTASGSTSVEWVQGSLLAKKQPLTWYKVWLNSEQMFYFCHCDHLHESETECILNHFVTSMLLDYF